MSNKEHAEPSQEQILRAKQLQALRTKLDNGKPLTPKEYEFFQKYASTNDAAKARKAGATGPEYIAANAERDAAQRRKGRPDTEPNPVFSAGTLADWLGITRRRLLQLSEKEPPIAIPGEHSGTYLAPETVKNYVAFIRETSRKAPPDEDGYSKEKEQARKAHWDAELAQLEYERKAGQLIPMDVLRRFLEDQVAAVLSVVQQEVLDKAAREVIFSRIREIDPDNYLSEEGDTPGNEGGDGATDAPDKVPAEGT